MLCHPLLVASPGLALLWDFEETPVLLGFSVPLCTATRGFPQGPSHPDALDVMTG